MQPVDRLVVAECASVVGGSEDDLELYDLTLDAAEQKNVAADRPDETIQLIEETLAYLLSIGTAEELLAPRRALLERFRSTSARG